MNLEEIGFTITGLLSIPGVARARMGKRVYPLSIAVKTEALRYADEPPHGERGRVCNQGSDGVVFMATPQPTSVTLFHRHPPRRDGCGTPHRVRGNDSSSCFTARVRGDKMTNCGNAGGSLPGVNLVAAVEPRASDSDTRAPSRPLPAVGLPGRDYTRT